VNTVARARRDSQPGMGEVMAQEAVELMPGTPATLLPCNSEPVDPNQARLYTVS
jgi:hypothetical protein